MNTLNDLRSTLDAHAADIHDDASRARVLAVHGRARAVRRRRAVAVAAAVAVVAAVAVTPRMLGDAEPAPVERELIGKVAPATVTSLGYTYDFIEGVEDDRIKLDASDEPRLLTWAVAGGPEDVLVDSRYSEGEVWSDGTDFDDFLVIHPGESGPWQIRRSGGAEVALAVYELTDARPAGYTVDGITFREQIGPETLVDAVIGEVGDTEHHLGHHDARGRDPDCGALPERTARLLGQRRGRAAGRSVERRVQRGPGRGRRRRK